MGRHSIAFVSYDPYKKDSYIDPDDFSHVPPESELQRCIHDAVRRAKKLVNHMPLDQLREYAQKVDRYVASGSSYLVLEEMAAGRNYASANESDCLRAFLFKAEHGERISEYPVLFGVLALCLAGEVFNTLWPSDKYLKAIGRATATTYRQDTNSFILDLAIEVVRAASFGEGLVFKARESENNRERAKKPSLGKQMLYDEFEAWVAKLPIPNEYTSTEDATNGFKAYLEGLIKDGKGLRGNDQLPNMLFREIGESTHKRLKDRLEAKFAKSGKKYPFPRRKTKKHSPQ